MDTDYHSGSDLNIEINCFYFLQNNQVHDYVTLWKQGIALESSL